MNLTADITFVVNTDGTVDIYAKKGATWQIPMFLKDADGNALNLAGWGARGQIRKTPNAQAVIASFACVVTPAEGKVVGSLAASLTTLIRCGDAYSDDASVYYYDFERYAGDPEVVTKDLPYGKLYVIPEVTR